MAGILDYFTAGRTPRDCQVEASQVLERNWDKADVFAVRVPVGGGKGDLALSWARWAHQVHALRSLVLVPNNILLEQYAKSNPRLALLRAKRDYQCPRMTSPEAKWNCQDACKELGHVCKGCPYTQANRKMRVVPWGACNYYTYMAHGLKTDVAIFDEAHNLRGMVRDMAAKRLWRHVYGYPRSLRTYKDLTAWVEQALGERPDDQKLKLLQADLRSGGARYLVEQGQDLYFGAVRDCLKLLPVDTSKEPPFLWPLGPKGPTKLILLSATLAPKDLEQLGLDTRRVCWIDTGSPIPAAQRPCYVDQADVSLKGGVEAVDIGLVAGRVAEIARAHLGTRGVVHTTYALLPGLVAALPADVKARVVTHGKVDKADQLAAFLSPDSAKDSILVCAGMAEGIDLNGPLARWQVITKIPWASLEEPAWAWLAETDPDSYAWEALKATMQTYGRVCRGPTDRGATFILDRSFHRLPAELFPRWFSEALVYAAPS